MEQARSSVKPFIVRRALFALISLLLLGIAALSAAIIARRAGLQFEHNAAANPQEEFDGRIAIEPPLDMPDFALLNQYGQTIRLSDLRGRYVLLSFGFTNCPDICPMTLNGFRRVRDSLGASAEEVAFVFISVDGERDSPRVLREYFAMRGLEGIIGLTGDEGTLRELGKEYGLSFERGESGAGGYMVSHTAGSFLLDDKGRWILRYQFGVPPSAIAADLKGLLAT